VVRAVSNFVPAPSDKLSGMPAKPQSMLYHFLGMVVDEARREARRKPTRFLPKRVSTASMLGYQAGLHGFGRRRQSHIRNSDQSSICRPCGHSWSNVSLISYHLLGFIGAYPQHYPPNLLLTALRPPSRLIPTRSNRLIAKELRVGETPLDL
jgi:hypothetical protein